MDTSTKLIIFSVLAVFYAPISSAYNYPPEWENLRVIDGELHISKPGGGTSLMYPDIGISKQIPVNTSKGQFLVPIEKTFPVVPAKVGKAATRFLKTLPAIGTAIALYDTVCDLTNICRDQSGELSYSSSPDGYPSTVSLGYWSGSGSSTTYPLPELVCHDAAYITKTWGTNVKNFDHYEAVPGSSTDGRCYYILTNNALSYSAVTKQTTSCPAGYTQQGSSCMVDVTNRPVTESDWSLAETKLDAQPQQTATSLYNSDAPVPVDASTHSDPVNHQIGTTSTQTKDAQGNITGTQTQTSTVTVTDNSTTSNITYNVTEITTITHYNEDNEITGTETSTSDNSPPKSSIDETTVSFDDVPPDQLETEEPDFDLGEPVSWGEGTCPPDVDLGIYGLSISYAPACDAAEMLRPIFILLASITAMFIVAGVSRKD